MKKNWKVLPELIKRCTSDSDSSIADILSLPDFKKYVLENEDAKYTSKNSEYIKKNKLEKVLLARQFLQRVKVDNSEVKVNAESIKRIKALFEEIKFK